MGMKRKNIVKKEIWWIRMEMKRRRWRMYFRDGEVSWRMYRGMRRKLEFIKEENMKDEKKRWGKNEKGKEMRMKINIKRDKESWSI